MLTIVCTAVLGGIGAIVGAAASNTEKGRKIDEKLEDSYRKFKNECKGASQKKIEKD